MKSYEQANDTLGKRDRRKLCNNTYLERHADSIRVRLHNTDIVTFYPSGDITLDTGGWNTVTTRDRMNTFSPFRVWSEGGRTDGYAFAALWSGDWQTTSANAVAFSGHRVLFIAGKLQGASAAEAREEIREARLEAARPRNRARYWTRKARGLHLDRSACAFGGLDLSTWQDGHYTPVGCALAHRWERRRARQVQEYECGCRVVHRAPSARGLTVARILAEENVTVRAAMMSCYGIQRFFLDARAKTVDEQAGYQLLELPMGEWQHARALQMECPSTGEIYVNPVPEHVSTVPQALDWIFDTTDYLGTVTQAT